jgi:outer membrane protein
MKNHLKISFVLVVLIGLSALATAQTERGNLLLSGSSEMDFAGYSLKVKNSYSDEDEGKISTIGFKSGAGYFIADNLALGLQFSLSYKSEKEDGDEFTEMIRMFLPFARLYFGKNNIKPFVQAAYGMGLQKTKEFYIEEEYITGYEIDGGMAVFFSKKLSLDFTLGYGSIIIENNDHKLTGHGIGGNIGISVIF